MGSSHTSAEPPDPLPGYQLSSRRVALRALGMGDADLLREIELHPENLRRWRHGGRTPHPGSAAVPDPGVLVQFSLDVFEVAARLESAGMRLPPTLLWAELRTVADLRAFVTAAALA